MPNKQECEFLVLRKIPYQSSAEIITGISPELGQMGFFIRKSSAKSKNPFAYFDLFRILRINYRKGRGELYYCQECDLLEDFSEIATNKDNFQAACWIAQFALANILPLQELPQFFQAMRVALRRLADSSQGPTAVLTGVTITYLIENGWLNTVSLNNQELAQCQLLFNMAQGKEMPKLTEENWQELFNWLYQQILGNLP